MLKREVQQFLRIGEIVVHHVPAIIFQGVRACSLVQDGANSAFGKYSAGKRATELCLVHIIGKPGTRKVQELLVWTRCIGEIVDHENVIFSLEIQFMDEIASNEAGSPCHDDHKVSRIFRIPRENSQLEGRCAYTSTPAPAVRPRHAKDLRGIVLRNSACSPYII